MLENYCTTECQVLWNYYTIEGLALWTYTLGCPHYRFIELLNCHDAPITYSKQGKARIQVVECVLPAGWYTSLKACSSKAPYIQYT